MVPLGLAGLFAQNAEASTTASSACPVSLDGLSASSTATSCSPGPTGPGDLAESPAAVRPNQAGPTTYTQINSDDGPLNTIYVGDDFSCQVYSAGNYNFFPGGSGGTGVGDCGTFLAIGDDLYGPDFSDHEQGGVQRSEAIGSFGGTGVNYTPLDATQSGPSGTGTSADPFQVSTAEQDFAPGVDLAEVDSYITGNDYYTTDVTITNTTTSPLSLRLYRGGDCQQQFGQRYGYTNPAGGGVGCAISPQSQGSSTLTEFDPATAGSSYEESAYTTVWGDIAAKGDLPNTCADCSTTANNNDVVVALNWDVTVPAGASTTISSLTAISPSAGPAVLPLATTQAASAIADTAATLNGTVDPQGIAVSSCVFQWGTTTSYGSSVPCAQTPGAGTGAVPVSAALSGLSPGSTYHYRLGATNAQYGTSWGADQSVTTPPTPPPAGRPSVVSTSVPTVSTSGAGLGGTVNPQGLQTTASFQVGIDPKYSGGGPVTYTQSTPTQVVGSDFTTHAVSGSVSGLLPNALYHARLVASNADGTVDGPDETFTTAKDAAPGAPTLGKTANLTPVSGLVFVKPPKGKTIYSGRVEAGAAAAAIPKGQGFVPLTQARQVPVGSQIDALRGSLKLVAATSKKRQTQAATLSGSVFSFAQNRSGAQKGLTTFTLKENAFKGAPSYTSCKATKKKTTLQPLAQIAKLSSKVLQTLRASDNHGKFRTKGRYSAATVRGTIWGVEDRCDGTLTKVTRGKVSVQDFHTRKTITLHAGHSFLARAF